MRERGGIFVDLLAAIGVVVVVLALIFAGCFSNAGASQPHSLGDRASFVAYHGGDDDGGDSYSQREGCGEQGGGCNNRRREDYSGACSKYNCQNFDKSPVDHSFIFAPTICMPGATCYGDSGDKRDDQGGENSPTTSTTARRVVLPTPTTTMLPGDGYRRAVMCLLALPFHCDEEPRR